MDIGVLFRNPKRLKDSYSSGFICIALLIIVGQIIIVNFAGGMFSVSPLELKDWLIIIVLTSPVLWIADIVRTIKIVSKLKVRKQNNR